MSKDWCECGDYQIGTLHKCRLPSQPTGIQCDKTLGCVFVYGHGGDCRITQPGDGDLSDEIRLRILRDRVAVLEADNKELLGQWDQIKIEDGYNVEQIRRILDDRLDEGRRIAMLEQVIKKVGEGLNGLLLDLYDLTIANAPLSEGAQRQLADDMARHIGTIRKLMI